MPLVGLTGLIVGLILLEPDLGTAGIITIIAFLMYFVAGGKIRYLIVLASSGLVVLGLLVIIAPYRLDRLTTFFDPSQDPQGIGYHVQQSYLAIGSGGLWGRGFGESRSKFQYLPEVTGDSIFPVIAEELGFFISSALVILYVYIFWRAMIIAAEAPDLFGRYLASGLGIWICAQSFINLSSMVGLVPLTGVPLPFVSYGGTAMASLLISAGLLLSISTNRAESSNIKIHH